tara:strand:- start:3199 stop:3918 length:720 start_codon:yes stop_codon:yes gene_type:complete
MSKKILGIIPARGGSKGIKDKNIFNLNGKPLIWYTIKAAKDSNILSDFIVSTDSKKIKTISEKLGAKVPFIRPASLAKDRSNAIPTLKHALRKYEKLNDVKVDYVVMLQPTAPLRLSSDIDRAIDQLIKSNADSIISVTNVNNYHPIKMKIIKRGYLYDYKESKIENPARQSLSPVFIVNGAIYATKRDILMNNNSLKGFKSLPYEMPDDRSVNIDSISDIVLANHYLIKSSIDDKPKI